MVALSFQKQFADDVADGRKRQTIRASDRKGQLREGVTLQLYTGMRTKACRKLRPDVVCHDFCPVLIKEDAIFTFNPQEFHHDKDGFARMDGFKDWAEMKAWFEKAHGLPFRGYLIRWLVPFSERSEASDER